MAVQTFSAAADLFKIKYGPHLYDALNTTTIGLGLLEKVGREKWGGKTFNEGARKTRNRSTTAIASGGAIPAAQRQGYDQFEIVARRYYGTGGVEAFGSKASNGSEAAFEEMLKAEVDGLISDSKMDFNIDFYGTRCGVLAELNVDATASVNWDMKNSRSTTYWEELGNRYFSPNQLLDVIHEVTGNEDDTDAVVSSVDSDRVGITADGVAAIGAAGALVVRAGSFGVCWTGLEEIIDDGNTLPAAANAGNVDLDTLQAVARSTETWAYASVVDLNSGALTENDVQNLCYRIRAKSGEFPEYFLTHDAVQGAFQQLLVGDRRYVKALKFPGGFKADALLYNAGDKDIPIITDRDCPYGRLYALNHRCLKHYVLQDIEMIGEDGSVLRQSGTGDEWQFSYRLFSNPGSPMPNGLGKMIRIGAVADSYFGASSSSLLYNF